jgi:hypothetical protein
MVRASLLGKGLELVDALLEIRESVLALAHQLEVGFDVAGAANELLVVGDKLLEALAIAHEGLRGLGVGPESGIGEARFY